MAHRVVILGGGTGGTLTANRLRRLYSEAEAEITVIDQDDRHVYQPGLLFVPFGLASAEDIVRPRGRQLHHGIDYVKSAIDHVDLGTNQVTLENGSTLGYDVLVVATGAVLVPEETEGLTGAGWMEKVFTFYSLEGAAALAAALASFDGGRLVVNVVDMPIKCPVAPLEFCFLADWYFHERGIRDQVQLTYVTPLDGAFTKPVASARLAGMLAEKDIDLVTEFNTGEVDGAGGHLIGYDGREVDFDLAVVVPLHGGAPYVGRSPGLGDELNFVPTDEHTLQSKAAPNVFVIGDAANVPASKAGSVTHFEGEVLVENIRRYLAGEPLDAELRRAHQLLHRDRIPQGPAHRLQLRHRATARSLPDRRRPALAGRVPAQPPRQAHVPVVLLARPAAGTRCPRHQLGHAHRRKDPRRK